VSTAKEERPRQKRSTQEAVSVSGVHPISLSLSGRAKTECATH